MFSRFTGAVLRGVNFLDFIVFLHLLIVSKTKHTRNQFMASIAELVVDFATLKFCNMTRTCSPLEHFGSVGQ